MKHSKSHEQCLLLHYFNEDEKEVANILLDLESLVRENQYRFQFYSLIWGSKKRRSNRGAESSSRVNSSPSLQGSSKAEHEFEPANTKIKTEFNSPATPLSFSPSESDENSKHSSRKSSKRKTREELMDMIKQLSQCRESLRGEVENVRNCYNNQKTYNLKLKAMKEQVTRMLNVVQGASVDNLGQLYSNRQQPFIMDQVALGSEAFHGFQYQLGQTTNGLGPMNHAGLGPIDLPDLNITVDETDSLSPFDLERMNVERKVQFAEARRRRRIKRIQIKNASGFIRPPRRT